MTARLCEWDGTPLRPAQKATCSDRCRAARWRWLNDVHTAKGAPDAPPWRESPLHGRRGEKTRSNAPATNAAAAPGPRSGANARSGIMLPYRKAVRVAREALRGHDPAAVDIVERALTQALAPTQRRKLEARDA